jgi:hypothetical protein
MCEAACKAAWLTQIRVGALTGLSDLSVNRRVLHLAGFVEAQVRADAEDAPEVLDGRDRFEGAGHNLAGASALGLLAETCLEQLSVGEDDAELVVQPVKDGRKIRNGRGGRSGRNARCASGMLRRHG